MPTGYTADLYDGKPQTFNEFAMSCARAFGALVTMRDEPSDAEIPDEFTPSDWSQKRLAEAEARRAELVAMSESQAMDAAHDEFVAAMKRHTESERKTYERHEAYAEMLRRASAWTPPTEEHRSLRDFMIQQLEESIRFDCAVQPAPERMTGQEWRDAAIKSAGWSINYHKKAYAEELERCAQRSEWVRSLRASLAETAVTQ